MKNEDRPTPNWLVFLFFGVALWGALYALFLHGFLGDAQVSLQAMPETAYVKASTKEVIPIRDDLSVEEGEKLYKAACAACHGMNREGSIGPNLADDEWWHTTKETELVRLVNRGIGAGQTKGPSKIPMPPKGGATISGEDVWKIVYFLASQNASVEQDAP